MSLDGECGGLFDRESVLVGGVPVKRANTGLLLIENRTAHLMAQSRQAVEPILTQAAAEERELALLEAFALGDEPPLRPASLPPWKETRAYRRSSGSRCCSSSGSTS